MTRRKNDDPVNPAWTVTRLAAGAYLLLVAGAVATGLTGSWVPMLGTIGSGRTGNLVRESEIEGQVAAAKEPFSPTRVVKPFSKMLAGLVTRVGGVGRYVKYGPVLAISGGHAGVATIESGHGRVKPNVVKRTG